MLKTNTILYAQTSFCDRRRRELTDEGDQPRRHSRLVGNQWWYPVEAPNRRPRKTTDVETRRKAFRELLVGNHQGRPLLSRPGLDRGTEGFVRTSGAP